MAKSTYEIREYVVNIDGNDETRSVIVYYDALGAEVTRAFYTGIDDILHGYVEKSSIIAEQQDPI